MITFQGPYHISQLGNLGLNRKRGVYIWGFAFRFKNGKCDSPVDLNVESILSDTNDCGVSFPPGIKFIPYYVGEGVNLFTRLNQHSKVRKSPASKYTRFSISYMSQFYKGNGFPVNNTRKNRVNNVIAFQTANHSCLEYYNSGSVLTSIYPSMTPIGIRNHWPIYNQYSHGNPLPDTLDILRTEYNNFFFCYAETDPSINLKAAEACTFWALKGFTIGKIENTKVSFSIRGSQTCTNLFRQPSPQPVTISSPSVFPGNY